MNEMSIFSVSDREVLEVRQRRVAGAEVVDRDGEALVAQQ